MDNKTILIVDDNPINLKLLKILLTIEGYIIHTATNGKEALSTLITIHPRIILMDIQLPDTDGLELTRRLKADPIYQDTIIIAITAFAMKGDKEKALAAGCDGYFSKPIDTNSILTVIASYLHSPIKNVKVNKAIQQQRPGGKQEDGKAPQ